MYLVCRLLLEKKNRRHDERLNIPRCSSSVYSPSSVPACLFTATAPSAFSSLSLHDALPICAVDPGLFAPTHAVQLVFELVGDQQTRDIPRVFVNAHLADHGNLSIQDRKSTRLNSSHRCISYAVFCLKKKTEGMTSV